MAFEDIKGVEKSAYEEQPDLYNKQIKTIPAPEREIGVDTKDTLLYNIINAAQNGQLDISMLDGFTSASQNRDSIYSLLDTMCEDAITAAVIETYAEDATEYNDQGQIVWCESSDPSISKYITFLLDSMSVDKHIYKWCHSLCKYGDLYLKLFHQSDIEEKDPVLSELNDKIASRRGRKRKSLNEDVNVKAYSKNDHYINYLEMAPNPAEVFELVKHGKTYAYIKADINSNQNKTAADGVFQASQIYNYKFKKTDVTVYQASEYVHACLEDNSSRTPETIEITSGKDEDGEEITNTYTVKRGQSLLYNNFKQWRELQLLENSVLLNRLTKSAITRVINVEVGDMPKEMVGPHLQGIKSLMEQKAALKTDGGMSEYTNPGPIENTIYVPTHEGIGALTAQTIGGDVDVKSLADLSYYQDKFFGGLRVPKQYFGVTNDNAGFSGGESLSIISSRYAKMVKRIQSTILQALTDAINILLLDRGLTSYANEFTLRMQAPMTSEEKDRRDNASSRINLVTDIMNTLNDIEDIPSKLKILKSLLSTAITNVEVIDIIQKEIDKLEEEQNASKDESKGTSENKESSPDLEGINFEGTPEGESIPTEMTPDEVFGGEIEEPEKETIQPEDDNYLPTPKELGVDLTKNI